jgi:hypothetical protein
LSCGIAIRSVMYATQHSMPQSLCSRDGWHVVSLCAVSSA